ncbi:SDR family oxidoreductase [Actinomadura rupiterrae]|uniref:SDR family oxidoreductase n=1 Tax=Actinomadura rupiterrae TaxID=559627 RepID=UPI0020A32638|nr:SDR family oxidoreductase [Actinomadura rupiterrae]MCP2343066.1 3-oxoacyl-[acyl-carrier protein] reductase [Actinomadura rupiterrae]
MQQVRDLTSRVALVIGGTRNQGAAIAANIASRGATTVITYANDDAAAKETVEGLDKRWAATEAVRSDATRADEVNALFEDVVTRHGRLDVVVHTPGAFISKPLADLTDADFDHLINLNTRSAFNTLRAAARHLSDNGRYVVLSTPLTTGLHSGSKAAVEQMVLAAAKELAARGITVNAVAPAPRDDITTVVGWLLSPEATWLTAQTLRPNPTLL